ncbi:MAG: class I SAM-dependent methyltransferase [Ardenticatenales bacterium]|nr:class I SAM-dependent methyltransferase [Ardenticatenales bacterium]
MSDWTDETAEWYAEKYGDYPTNRLAVDQLELEPTARIVDVGCGTGSALRHAALTVTEGHLIGVDPISRMIEIAEAQSADHPHADRLEFRQGSAEAIPVEARDADLVLAFDSFDHWRDVDRGLAEIRRILRGVANSRRQDGGCPQRCGRNSLATTVTNAGFTLIEQQEVRGEGITFALWRFQRNSKQPPYHKPCGIRQRPLSTCNVKSTQSMIRSPVTDCYSFCSFFLVAYLTYGFGVTIAPPAEYHVGDSAIYPYAIRYQSYPTNFMRSTSLALAQQP